MSLFSAPTAPDCPRCGEPCAWVGDWRSGVSQCDRCANDPAVIMEWVRKHARDDAVPWPSE